MWWESKQTTARARAVAYYRHSAEDRQENSIPIQRAQIRKFAVDNNIDIIKEFEDAGKSGVLAEGRDAFNDMLDNYVQNDAAEFELVLVLDVSRWGRFLNIDRAAYFAEICSMHNKQVVYTTIGFAKPDDLAHQIRISIDRYQSADFIRKLSRNVFLGSVNIVQQGFRAGAPAAYALDRLLVDETRKPVQVLAPGQHKSISNQRVTLIPGNTEEVAVVRKIFKWYVRAKLGPKEIASALNAEDVPSPGGKQWTSGCVRTILADEQYVGTMVYYKTTQKLKTKSKRTPRTDWIRRPNAFECVVERELFDTAQELLKADSEQYTDEALVKKLGILQERYGFVTPSLVASEECMASPATYVKHFHSMDTAYQKLFPDVLARARQAVVEELRTKAGLIEEYDDFIVLDRSFSVLIQPAVATPLGYREYWPFRPDPRRQVDITLGVPLSSDGEHEILGYLVLPRLFVKDTSIRVFASSAPKFEMYGHRGLEMVLDLIEQRSQQ